MFSYRHWFRKTLIALCAIGILSTPTWTLAAEKAEHETLSLKAVPLFQIGKFYVTNSMLASWIVALAVIIFAQLATRNIKTIPTGAQNFWEWLVESLYNFLESIIGSELVKKTFWFFATIFIFILFTNWAGLIPGVGTIGWGHSDPATGAFRIDRPLMRGANADLNMTSAMALIFFVLWLIWALQANGIGGFLMHLFGPKGETSGVLKILMVVVFFFVGWLEIISILFRPVSLSFRLFGNIFAGESILDAMSHMVPFVQALVFMLLTAIFTLLIAQHSPGEEAH
jgi:F-type H+-transporting ATPase subunit a